MSININKNSYVTRKTAEKQINYPEHKLKNEIAIVLRDSEKNITLFDKSDIFFALIKQWEQDQYDLNFNRTHHKNRTISKEELEQKLDNKKIATTYTITENALFFMKKFNNNPQKIAEYYQDVLNAFLEEAGIPKENLINAIIHFDQTTPHLHFAISNIQRKYSKDLKREVLTVNYEKTELLKAIIENKKSNELSWQKWIELKEQREKYYNNEISKTDWEVYRRNNYEAGLLFSIEQKVNEIHLSKYNEKLYKNEEDYIFIEKIRGFSNDDLKKIAIDRSINQAYSKMENNIVFKSRLTTLETEINKLRYKYRFKTIEKDKELIKLNNEMLTAFENKNELLAHSCKKQIFDKTFNEQYKNFVIEFWDRRMVEERQQLEIINETIKKWSNQTQQPKAYIQLLEGPSRAIKARYIAGQVSEYIRIAEKVGIAKTANVLTYDEQVTATKLDLMFKEWFNIDVGFARIINIEFDREKLKPNEKFQVDVNRTIEILNDFQQIQMIDFFWETKIKNNWAVKKELFFIEKQNEVFKEKAESICSTNFKLQTTEYERMLMLKKVHRERVDYDLKLLNLYKPDKTFGKYGEKLNGIERNRIYNQVLEFCYFKSKQREQIIDNAKNKIISYDRYWKSFGMMINNEKQKKQELEEIKELISEIKKGVEYTPQTLAKEMFEKSLKPIDYHQELENINKNVKQSEKQQAIEDLNYTKKLEIAITYQKQGKEQEEHFNKIKNKEMSYDVECKAMEITLEKHKQEILERSKEITKESRTISGWLEQEQTQEHIKEVKKEQKELHKDKELQHNLKMDDELYSLNIVQECIMHYEKTFTKQLEIEFKPFGIDMDLAANIAKEAFIQEHNLEMNKSQSQEKDISDEKDIHKVLFIDDKDLEFDASEDISMDYPDVSTVSKDSFNYETAANIEMTIAIHQKDREIEMLLDLEREGYNIEQKAKDYGISSYAVQKAAEIEKTRAITRDATVDKVKEIQEDLSMGRSDKWR